MTEWCVLRTQKESMEARRKETITITKSPHLTLSAGSETLSETMYNGTNFTAG